MVDRGLSLLRHWMLVQAGSAGGRIPPERTLSAELGLSRAELRKALAALEAEGRLTRHVGRGTFLNPLPSAEAERQEAAAEGAAGWHALAERLAASARPRDALQARLVLEPELARLAALNATGRELDAVRVAEAAVAATESWADYDAADRGFHRSIAAAAGNPLLAALHDVAAAAAGAVAWGRLADRGVRPVPGHPSLAEHGTIAAAIARRDEDAAASAMRHHLLVETAAALPRLI